MNFKYLVESCVTQHKGKKVTKEVAEEIIRGVFEDIVISIKSGQKISIRGFGNFEAVTKKARTYHNPKTGEKVAKGEFKYPKFHPSPLLKASIREE